MCKYCGILLLGVIQRGMAQTSHAVEIGVIDNRLKKHLFNIG
jgi:hypothetical protein